MSVIIHHSILIKYRVYFTLSAAVLKSVMTRVFSFRQTFSCRLLQRMARMDIETWKWWEFWSFKPMHGKMTKKVITIEVNGKKFHKALFLIVISWYRTIRNNWINKPTWSSQKVHKSCVQTHTLFNFAFALLFARKELSLLLWTGSL